MTDSTRKFYQVRLFEGIEEALSGREILTNAIDARVDAAITAANVVALAAFKHFMETH